MCVCDICLRCSLVAVIDKAVAAWLDAEDETLRRMLLLDAKSTTPQRAKTATQRARTVQQLRTIARIEWQVEQWGAKDTAQNVLPSVETSGETRPASASPPATTGSTELTNREHKIAAAMAEWIGE